MHRFIPDPDASHEPPAIDPTHTAAIKTWTAAVLHLGPDDAVHVAESPCRDPGCPLVETTVTVFGADASTRLWRFTRPRAAITRGLVKLALSGSPTPR